MRLAVHQHYALGHLGFRRHGVDVRGHDLAHRGPMLQDHAASDVTFRDHAHQLLAFENWQKRDVVFLHFAQGGARRGIGGDGDERPALLGEKLARRWQRHELLERAQPGAH